MNYCKNCKITVNRLDVHYKSKKHLNKVSKSAYCAVCEVETTNIYQHNNTKKHKNLSKDKNYYKKELQTKYDCKKCGYSANSRQSLYAHNKKTHEISILEQRLMCAKTMGKLMAIKKRMTNDLKLIKYRESEDYNIRLNNLNKIREYYKKIYITYYKLHEHISKCEDEQGYTDWLLSDNNNNRPIVDYGTLNFNVDIMAPVLEETIEIKKKDDPKLNTN